MNKVIIVGNLGRDPELRNTTNGTPVCNLNVATSRKFKNASGEVVEETEWHRVVVWGKQAETCAKYLAKGRTVAVDGRLKTGKYEKDGETRYSTDIVADDIRFVGGGKGAEGKDEPAANFPPGGFGSDDDLPL